MLHWVSAETPIRYVELIMTEQIFVLHLKNRITSLLLDESVFINLVVTDFAKYFYKFI